MLTVRSRSEAGKHGREMDHLSHVHKAFVALLRRRRNGIPLVASYAVCPVLGSVSMTNPRSGHRSRDTRRRHHAVLPVLFFTIACGGQGAESGSPPSAAEEALRQGRQTFMSRCSACHGADGVGNGPGAASLSPKPRNLRDPAWQDHTSDEDIRKIIVSGGAAVGRSPSMPGAPDLADDAAAIDGLVKFIRSLKE